LFYKVEHQSNFYDTGAAIPVEQGEIRVCNAELYSCAAR